MYSNINMKNLSGWGRFPKFYTKELTPKSESQLFEILTNNKSFIPRGNGGLTVTLLLIKILRLI